MNDEDEPITYLKSITTILDKKSSNPYRVCKYERKVRHQRIKMGFPAHEVISNRRTLRPQIKQQNSDHDHPMEQINEEEEDQMDSDEEERRSKVIEIENTREKKSPLPIGFSSPVFCVNFNPNNNIIAAGLVSGSVQLYKYSIENSFLVGGMKHHNSSIRALYHSPTKDQLFCCSSDKSISIVNTDFCSIEQFWKDAHDSAINRIYSFNENILSTGDDNGAIKLWDLRQGNKHIADFKQNTNFISDFTSQDQRFLLATSGDGCLSVFDVRKKEPFLVSENQEEELLCCSIVKNGSKVVIGSSGGNMRVFNWKQFGATSDSFPLLSSSLSTFCEFLLPSGHPTRNFAGCSDGRIRVLNFFPHKVVTEIGAHSKGYPIESMALSYDNKFIATSGHDQKVRFWDVERFFVGGKSNDNDQMETDNTVPDANGEDLLPNHDEEKLQKDHVKVIVDNEVKIIKPLIKKTRVGHRKKFFSGF